PRVRGRLRKTTDHHAVGLNLGRKRSSLRSEREPRHPLENPIVILPSAALRHERFTPPILATPLDMYATQLQRDRIEGPERPDPSSHRIPKVQVLTPLACC